MKKQVDFLKKHLDTEFTIQDFRMHDLFPWARDYRLIGKIIREDMASDNVLEARIVGTGNGTRYYVKGRNIIRYVKKYGQALMSFAKKNENGKR